jgi:hypothetical protein
MTIGILNRVRSSCKEVVHRAKYVHLNEQNIPAFALSLIQELSQPQVLDPTHHFIGSPEDTLAFIFILDSINFGSGYFPYLIKQEGLSGYYTISTALKNYFEENGPIAPGELIDINAIDCANLFGQVISNNGPVSELMTLFAKALNDLGNYILDHFHGQYLSLLVTSDESVERLVDLLIKMPFFKDEAVYDNMVVHFYKRAQITASDISLAFGGQGLGYFYDLDQLTIFADNAVPHVLRVDGIIEYDDQLASLIDSGELILPSSEEEIEIRAAAIYASELVVEYLSSLCNPIMAKELDYVLWNRAHGPKYNTRPRHHTRTVFY